MALPDGPTFRPQREETPGAGAARPRLPLRAVLQVAAGGAIGAGLRYAFLLAFPQDQGRFPLTIFVENVAGAFLLGIVLTVLLRRSGAGWDARPFLATGVLGSFTTFSNVSLDLVRLAGAGHPGTAFGYAAASAAVGLLAAGAGVWAGRRVPVRRPA
jgi:fluoride exporter